MLVLNKTTVLLGLILVGIAGLCPLLEVQIIFKWISWNLYKIDIRLFIITYAMLAIMALCYFVRQIKTFKLLSRVLFLWILLMAGAIYFKSTHYSGIGIADSLLGKAIHFQWGWILYIVGAVLLLASVEKKSLP